MGGFFGGGGASVANMVGATSSAAGTAGLVPAPAAGDQGDVLFGDGTFSPHISPSGGAYGTDYVGWPRMSGGAVFNNSSLNVSANLLIRGGCFYFKGVYNRIALYVTTGSAGKNARIGIYDIDNNGYETSLLTSAIVGLDNTGFAEATVSEFFLNSGFYATALIIDSAGASVNYGPNNTNWNRPFSTFNNSNNSPNSGSNMVFGGYYSRTYSDGLPSTLATTGYTSYNTTIIHVRKV